MRRVTVAEAKIPAADFRGPEDLARSLRRADEFIRIAVAAGWTALAGKDHDPARTGIYLGTAFGPLETNFSSLATLIDDGEGQISPTLFSHSVFNVAAGYVARLLGILGPSLTMTSYSWPFVSALAEARTAVAHGEADLAVVIAAEVYSDLLRDAYCREFGVDDPPLAPGGAAWLLAADGPGPELAAVEVTETPCGPAFCLTREGEGWQGEGLSPAAAPQPMAHVEALTRAVASLAAPGAEFVLTAPFGRARLVLHNP